MKNGLALSTSTNWATERVFGLERAIHHTDGAQLKGVCVCAHSFKCSFTELYLQYGTVLRPLQMCARQHVQAEEFNATKVMWWTV